MESGAIWDDIKPIHVVFRRVSLFAAKLNARYRFEIALPAIEKIAVQSKNDIRATNFGINRAPPEPNAFCSSSCLICS